MAKKTTTHSAPRKTAQNGKQTFTFKAPTAMSVLLAGDFTQWQANPICMQKGADGCWQAAVALPPGTHHYRFLVDGQWSDDPECTLRVQNVFGSQDCVCQIG